MHIFPVVEEDTWISGFDIARDSDTRRGCGTTGRVDNGLGTSERQLVDVKGCVICGYVRTRYTTAHRLLFPTTPINFSERNKKRACFRVHTACCRARCSPRMR